MSDQSSYQSYALGEVDWHELADAWIETATEQIGASA